MFDQLIAKTGPAASAVATVKPAPKASAKTGNKTRPATVKPAHVASEIKFAVVDFARPRAGAALAAHTAAFLGLSGMAGGVAYPKAQAAKIIGARAVQYHTDNGNFTHTDKGLKLTEKGELFFLCRNIDPELLKAYEAFFAKGEVNASINVKAPTSAVKL